MLTVVDNRTCRRLVYEVLDHDPANEDIERLFRRLKALLEARGLVVFGITTDGSPLYPEPIARVFGKIPHQICEFHVIKEINKAVLKAVAKVRKCIKARMPKLPRGRPATREAKRKAAKKKRLQKKVADLFDNRHLWVQHDLGAVGRKTLRRLTRGLPDLRTIRRIMDEVYRLFDRRCRTGTALKKLDKLRNRIRRFKKLEKTLKMLFNPHLEKALTFLDDSLLPSTANAVERGCRRHRKMQKTVYRLRKRHTLKHRLALDHIRDRLIIENASTLAALHESRLHRKTSNLQPACRCRQRAGPIPRRRVCLTDPATLAKAG